VPRLLGSGPARVAIWLSGQAIFWSGLFLAFSIAWYWLIAVGALSYPLSRLALMPIVGSELEAAKAARRRASERHVSRETDDSHEVP